MVEWTNLIEYLHGMISFLWNPGFGVYCLILILHLIFLSYSNRRKIGNVLDSPFFMFWRVVMFGFLAGLMVSICLAWTQWEIRLEESILIWITTAILAIFHLRFACLACTAGILTLTSLILQNSQSLSLAEPWQAWGEVLLHFDGKTWCYLACILHFVEWILIRLDGAIGVKPIEMKHSKSERVSGILMKKGWPIPLVLPTPTGLTAVPLFLSFSQLTLSKPLRQQKRWISTMTFLYALTFLGGMLLTEVWASALWGVALYSVIGHEVLYWIGRALEKKRAPLFVSDGKGLKVLMVIPGSPAQEMGLSSGDVIQRVNGRPIRTMEDLEQAVENAAYCKMEVLDVYQHRHIIQKALYEGVPTHLGIVGAVSYESKKAEEVEEFHTVGSSP